MKNIKYISLFLGVAIIALSLSGCASSNASNNNTSKSAIGVKSSGGNVVNNQKKAADFELKDLQGTSHKLSDYAGKKVYIKFWASWCSICLAGLDEVNTLAKDNKDFTVITIVSPGFRGEKNSEDFIKWFNGLNYKNLTVLLDEGGKVSNQYGVRGYPTSVAIASDGTLVKTTLGQNSNEQIKSQFKAIK